MEDKNNNRFADIQLMIAQMKANFKFQKDIMDVVLTMYPDTSRQLKARFDSLVDSGFSREQVLHIVTEQGWAPR